MRLLIFRGQELFVDKNLITSKEETLGRTQKNTIILRDPRISRSHARIYFSQGVWRIEDLGSQNGVVFRGQEIKQSAIIVGEEYFIGPFVLRLQEVTHAEKILESTQAFMDAISVRADADQLEQLSKAKGSVKKSTAKSPDSPSISKSRLVVTEGEKSGTEYELSEEGLAIDESSLKDLEIGTLKSGTQKATIVSPKDGTFVLRTNDASFPRVKVDGVPVKERELENHDVIELGKSKVEFVTGNSKASMRKTGVIERPATRVVEPSRITSKTSWAKLDWRTLMVLGLLVGSSIAYLGIYKKRRSVDLSTANRSSSKDALDENAKVAALHLNQAQEMIRQGDLQGAEEKVMFVLQTITPGNESAKELAEQIQTLKLKVRKDQEEAVEVEKKRKETVRELVIEADRMADEDKFTEAKEIYEKALSLDPENVLAKAALEHMETVRQESERESLAKKKLDENTEKIYQQGVAEFEKGHSKEALRYFEEVLKVPDHKRYESARKMTLSLGGSVPDGSSTEKNTQQLFVPMGGGSSSVDEKAGTRSSSSSKDSVMDKAREAYNLGQQYLEITNDPAQALDQFEKVLELIPDEQNELHQKAARKIKQLTLEP